MRKKQNDKRYTRHQVAWLLWVSLTLLVLNSCDMVVSKPLFTVEPLPYGEKALAPHISAKTLQYHHGKHYAAYVEAANRLADEGRRVIIAGLDQDYLGRPFPPMPDLMAIAEEVMKVRAVCNVCGGTASRSQRLQKEGATVLVGGSDKYEARCRACHQARDVPPVPTVDEDAGQDG